MYVQTKCKQGIIERVQDEYTLIGKDLFKRETDMNMFVGMKVTLEDGRVGAIESSFGKSGKFKATFREGGLRDASGKIFLRILTIVMDIVDCVDDHLDVLITRYEEVYLRP
eukprot:TRINITY_DN7700_c0_g1_i2.p3 TRINITY_DN7700_c0_g1~~TRINITY_DN7700_c0_g1_i2.p3  ORF type:complete len:111 (-),score=25.01 TRINITY_DN7700_c0_g1_i2:959-1291(-)